jgi:hypothetical protein
MTQLALADDGPAILYGYDTEEGGDWPYTLLAIVHPQLFPDPLLPAMFALSHSI